MMGQLQLVLVVVAMLASLTSGWVGIGTYGAARVRMHTGSLFVMQQQAGGGGSRGGDCALPALHPNKTSHCTFNVILCLYATLCDALSHCRL